MATNFKVRVSNAAINRMVKALDVKIEKQTNLALKEAAEHSAAYAQKLYGAARYDGDMDAVVTVSKTGKWGWTVIARGTCVMFIEFGTGIFRDPSYKNKTTGRPYWWFSGKGKNIKNGTHARKTYWRTTREVEGDLAGGGEVFEVKAPFGSFETDWDDPNLDEAESGYSWYDEETDTFYEAVKRRDISQTGREKVEKYSVDYGEKSDSYITKGTPAFHPMLRAREEMVRRFYSNFNHGIGREK